MAAGLNSEALQPLLEQAVRESLRELARSAVEPEVGGSCQSIDSIVQSVSARVLEQAGHFATALAPGAPCPSGPQPPPTPPKPLLSDLVATPWVIWREAAAPQRERAPVPGLPHSHSWHSDAFAFWGSEDHHDKHHHHHQGLSGAGAPGGIATCAGSGDAADGAPEVEREVERTEPPRRRAGMLPVPGEGREPGGVRQRAHSPAWAQGPLQLQTADSDPLASSIASIVSPAHLCGTGLFPGLSLGTAPLVVKGGLTMESSDAHHLVMQWQGRPRAVLMVAKPGDQIVSANLQDMAAWLCSQGIVVVLEPQLLADQPQLRGLLHGVRTFSSSDALEQSIDLVITIGGDGTLTWAVSLFHGPMPPTLSFAAGSLGFLTPFPLENWVRTLTRLLDLHRARPPIPLVCRMRLRVAVHRRRGGACGGVAAAIEQKIIHAQCLNEVLVHRGQSGTLAKLDVGVDGERVTLVQGDGLILATPTGSTAYSLAAGGSMVHPAVPAILLTPVSPHSLSFRPALLPDSAVVTVGVPLTARSGAALSVDGKDICTLRIGDSVEVAMSPHPVPTICRTTETGDWFASVHEALQWNGRAEQK